jgi:hypothetical protein
MSKPIISPVKKKKEADKKLSGKLPLPIPLFFKALNLL